MQAAYLMTVEVHVDPKPGKSFMDLVPRTLMFTNFTVNGKAPTRRILLGLIDAEPEEEEEEEETQEFCCQGCDLCNGEHEAEIRDEQFLIQDQFAAVDRSHSTRFTIHETLRFSWDPSQTLYVASCAHRDHCPKSRRELRRDGLIKGRRNEGRKPIRKHRDRRPQLRETLQDLWQRAA